ncbi:MAG: hypothetical protein IPO21_17315 [Bacteroidales bacterium]|nr:hypothetical protein [Bacteroidales bacterium]
MTSQFVDFDSLLTLSGNDFMSCVYTGDTLLHCLGRYPKWDNEYLLLQRQLQAPTPMLDLLCLKVKNRSGKYFRTRLTII